RDEFTFRCVYCLLREQWGLVRGTFAIDHFLPVAIHPELISSTVADGDTAQVFTPKGFDDTAQGCRTRLPWGGTGPLAPTLKGFNSRRHSTLLQPLRGRCVGVTSAPTVAAARQPWAMSSNTF